MKLKSFIVLALLMSLQTYCLKKGEETNRILYSVEYKTKILYADTQNASEIRELIFVKNLGIIHITLVKGITIGSNSHIE